MYRKLTEHHSFDLFYINVLTVISDQFNVYLLKKGISFLLSIKSFLLQSFEW